MRFCPWVLYEWKRKFSKSTPTPLGASSNANLGGGEFNKYIEGLEEGEQCIRIAVSIYFQHRLADSFLKDQLAQNKSNFKVSIDNRNFKLNILNNLSIKNSNIRLNIITWKSTKP